MSDGKMLYVDRLAFAFRAMAAEYGLKAVAPGEDETVREICEFVRDFANELVAWLENGADGTAVDAVPREEHESLVRRFEHLLESDYIRSFDEVIPLSGGKYKRDIREADLENQRAHWIANCTCSRCLKGIRGYAIQSGYVFCPFCGADMREVDPDDAT